uniref:Uncharacterized protein n=1 Tax=Lactuca sativa TaxID=4236 RepID=A0A9R1UMI2_LACSA|nr:hypothetical protein LSAT_V11C800452950 [Lactuca sativa]
MSDIGFLIANKYGVIVYFLDKQGSSTYFPLWHGPEDISHHRSIVITFVYNDHYVKVDLQESHPMPTVLSLWHHHISQRAVGWDILYNVRLNAYISPNALRRMWSFLPILGPTPLVLQTSAKSHPMVFYASITKTTNIHTTLLR